MRTIWLEPDLNTYVPRCGRCGHYKNKEDLRQHWFFNGMYCVGCIQDVLYDDARIMREIR